MTGILFVCHGNICRSPMAEFILNQMIEEAGLAGQFYADSAATSTEELGNPVYPPVRRLLALRGIDCSGKRARQLTRSDYDRFALLIGMDRANLRDMHRICGGDPAGRMHLLLDFTSQPGQLHDPWYTRDFEGAQRQIEKGCRGLLTKFCAGAPGG